MHSIEIELHPLTGYQNKPLRSIKFGLPEQWDELTADQILAIAPLYFQRMPEMDFKLHCLACLLPARTGAYLRDEEILRLLPCLDWLTQDVSLTKQNFREIYYGLSGPKDGFENMTVAEYITADQYFCQYLQDEAEEDLHLFVACLFRPIANKRDSSDKRAKFSQDATGYLPKVKRLKPAFLLAQILWFAGCKRELCELYPSAFPKPHEEAPEQASEGGGWNKVLFYIAEQKLFGDFANLTENTYIHNIFSYIDSKIEQNNESTASDKEPERFENDV